MNYADTILSYRNKIVICSIIHPYPEYDRPIPE